MFLRKKYYMPNTSDLPLPDNFEAGLEELEAIIATLEKGELSLEAQMEYYSRGSALLRFCGARLTEVEQHVKILNAADKLVDFTLEDN